jgi:glutathione synthase/RimK-type ligase-like ATP-grasp enzyme
VHSSDALTIVMEDQQIPCLIGLAALAKMAFRGADLAPIAQSLMDRCHRNAEDAAALMDLSLIELFQGRAHGRAQFQARALKLRRTYRHAHARATARSVRVLALAAPGDLMANTPIEFLVEDADIVLEVLYILPGSPLPDVLPQHDLAFVIVAEGNDNKPLLDRLAERTENWPRPVLNNPNLISRLTRDGAWALLASIPGAHMPVNVRIDRASLVSLGRGETQPGQIARGCRFPILVRPVGSHAGEGLEKLEDRAAIPAYLARQPQAEFFMAPFVDYRSPDRVFRKYRIVLIGGQAYACHMAISSHWMIHYLNADMIDNGQNRAEEARFMQEFDHDFGARHRAALQEIARRSGLDYLVIDCAETPDGRLLIFEVGNAMIVHAMDPESVFPYKSAQMKKLFGAFQAMLRDRALEGASRPAHS